MLESDPAVNLLKTRYKKYKLLMQGPKDANGLLSRPTILFFDGDKAAIAAKQARPLDLHTISLRNDSGMSNCSYI